MMYRVFQNKPPRVVFAHLKPAKAMKDCSSHFLSPSYFLQSQMPGCHHFCYPGASEITVKVPPIPSILKGYELDGGPLTQSTPAGGT